MAIDPYQYIASYGDLIEAFGANATAGEQHYLNHGIAERRQPDDFDEQQYLANYPDLKSAFGDDGELATLHYIRNGYAEGRNDNEPPPPGFDGLQYIASYGDLIDALGANPDAGERHYLGFGREEGRQTDAFDEEQYLVNYPDLAAVFNGDGDAATLHYILFGKDEGRSDTVPGNTPPTAVADAYEVSEDADSTPLAVLDNDSDADAGDAITVASVNNLGTLGTVALGPGGAVAYDPGDAFEGLAPDETATDTFQYTIDDGKGGTASAAVTVTITGENDSPLFTSADTISVLENTTAVVALAASDPEQDPVTYAITGGDDAALFTITDGTQLAFIAAPDYETPADGDEDNVYLVQVTADDGAGGTTPQGLTVTVTDDLELTLPEPPVLSPTSVDFMV